jgi:hypothetical protein
MTPTIINVIGFWLIEIPLAWALAFPAHLAVRGVYIAIPIAELFITLMGLAMFLRGRWKEKRPHLRVCDVRAEPAGGGSARRRVSKGPLSHVEPLEHCSHHGRGLPRH